MARPGATRDPVSESFDAAARRLLARAYSQRGEWVAVWLPDPTLRQRTRWASTVGIGDLTGPDPVPRGGGVDARTRWARAFVRAIYWQHKWHSPMRSDSGWRSQRRAVARATGGLRIQVGRHVAASPQFNPADPQAGGLPARRRIRVQLAAGGQAKDRAVARLANRDRIYQPDGEPAARFAQHAWRDW